MKALFAGAVYLALLAVPAAAQTAQTALSPQDFVTSAAVSNQFEIESSKVALEKSSSDAVKEFAHEMIADHGKAGDELKQAADKANVPPATDLDGDRKAQVDALRNKAGVEFDQAYVVAQVKAHDDAVSVFSAYADHGTQSDLKAFAADTLPTLRKHQEEARRLAAATSPPPAAKPDAALGTTPLVGGNSFTKGQARTRLRDAGYGPVSGLAQDDRGVWRGKAVKNGSRGDVAVGFQGTIVVR